MSGGIEDSGDANLEKSKKNVLRIIILAAAVCLIILGLMNGGFRDMWAKATKICLECMGIG